MSIRIKDLTTTATSAATDDYIALDGASQGTRKILASDIGGGSTSDDITNESTVSGETVTDAFNSLNDQIANEATARQSAVSSEASTRESADESLRSAIDALVSPSGQSVVVDSSLSISGAAADAKVTGDLKNNVTQIETELFAKTNDEVSASISVTSGTQISADNKAVSANIGSGGKYKILLTDTIGAIGASDSVNLYEWTSDSTKSWKGSFKPNEEKEFTANANIVGLSFYYQNPLATGTINFSVKYNFSENHNAIQNRVTNLEHEVTVLSDDVDSLLTATELYSNADLSMTGTTQYVTKDVDIDADLIDSVAYITVGSTENVTVSKPIRYRFLDTSNAVVGADKYMAAGTLGVANKPSSAKLLRISFYGTYNSELVSTTAHFYNVRVQVGDAINNAQTHVINDENAAESITKKCYAQMPDNPFIPSYAHKGYCLTAPECTASAMIEAKRMGFTGVENDTQLTSDGNIVMWHDATLDKLGDSHAISDYTLAQLQAMDFGAWKNANYVGEKILTFEEWVCLCKNLGLKLIIDSKFEYTNEQITSIVNTLVAYGVEKEAIFILYGTAAYLTTLVTLLPDCTVVYLTTATEERCQTIQTLMTTYPDITVALCPDIASLTKADTHRAHTYGIKQFCYTAVDYTSDINLATLRTSINNIKDYGIDAITSDIYRYVDVINGNIF